MDVNQEFEKCSNLWMGIAHRRNVKEYGHQMAGALKKSMHSVKGLNQHFFIEGFNLAKANASDEFASRLKATIEKHYDRLNNVLHEEGYNDKIFGQLMGLDFVEEVINEMIEAQEPSQ